MIKLDNYFIDKRLNSIEYNKQINYFKKYYGNNFFENQGTEDILEMINKFCKKGNWLDVGSGSNVLFWASAFKEISEITCIDISVESFLINEQLRLGELNSKAFDYVYNEYNKNFNSVASIPIDYYVLDFFNEQFNINARFKNISQFGLLGLLKNKSDYIRKFGLLVDLLDDDGVIFGSNWIFSKKLESERGYSNSYLNTDLIHSICKIYSLKILSIHCINIQNDKNYDKVLVYCLAKI